MNLFFRELGEGQPLIILHGVFGSSDNWLSPAKVLSSDFKVYLLDQRNHGQSPNSDEFNNNLLAEDLAKFIATHKIESPIIIGHSMGGKVAMNFAAKHGKDIKKLVVVDIAPRYYPPHHQSILAGLNAINLSELKGRQEADDILKTYEPELGVRQFLLKNIYRNEKGEFSWRINLPVITEKIDNVAEAINEDMRIDVPTLFIRGGNSKYIQEKDYPMINKIFTDCRIETIEGAGHWVQAEKPVEFLTVVKQFIS